MEELVIIGGGGHAKVLIGAVISMNRFEIKGILDAKIPQNKSVLGYQILGDDRLLVSKEMRRYSLALGFGTTRADRHRQEVFLRFKEMDYCFPTIQHTTAHLSEGVSLGEGVQVMAGVVIQPAVKIGSNCILNTSSVVEHDCQIEGHCHIAPGAVIGGDVQVGEGSFIGLGARVVPGVRIGRGVTVGAGAVVLMDIEDGTTVAGVPAKPV